MPVREDPAEHAARWLFAPAFGAASALVKPSPFGKAGKHRHEHVRTDEPDKPPQAASVARDWRTPPERDPWLPGRHSSCRRREIPAVRTDALASRDARPSEALL